MREHEEERVDSTVKEGRLQGGKEGQATRASLEQVEGSMRRWTQELSRTMCRVLVSGGKEVGRRRARSYDKRVK